MDFDLNSGLEAAMDRWRRLRDGGRLRGPAILIIAVILGFLLMHQLTPSLSGKTGQADIGFGSVMMSRLCIKIMESGSSLISYQTEDKEKEDMLMGMLSREFPAYGFTGENRSLEALLQDTKPFITKDNSPVDTHSSFIDTDNNALEQTKQTDGIRFHEIKEGTLTKEYILTNGAAYDRSSFLALVSDENRAVRNTDGQLSVGVMEGEVYVDESDGKVMNGLRADVEVMRSNIGTAFTMEDLKDISFLLRNFYILDPSTSITDEMFDSEKLLGKDMTIKQKNDAPQILIYHTHSREAYADSREGVTADTVVGMGNYLTQILEDQYGYNVIHDTTAYDKMSKGDANLAYNYAYDGIAKILEENPTIEVVIDLHRDGVEKRSTILQGKETAQIMLFNGLSRNLEGPRPKLDNPYLQDNLAFSFQLQLKSLEKYPGLFYRNYLKGYRYNLHLRPKSMLIELGTYKNTLASARNAVEPFAEVLDEVLQGR